MPNSNNIPAPDPTKKASNMPYVIAVVVMALLGVIFVLAITMLRPQADNTQMITTVLGFVGAITASVLSFMKSDATHTLVNSQWSQWKLDYAALLSAQGVKEAVSEEQARVALMKDKAVQAERTTNLIAAIPVARVESALIQDSPTGTQDKPISVKVDDSAPVRVKETGS